MDGQHRRQPAAQRGPQQARPGRRFVLRHRRQPRRLGSAGVGRRAGRPVAGRLHPAVPHLLVVAPQRRAGPYEGGVWKCELQSVDRALRTGSYGDWRPTADEKARLEQVFPDGVCNWDRPDVGRPAATADGLDRRDWTSPVPGTTALCTGDRPRRPACSGAAVRSVACCVPPPGGADTRRRVIPCTPPSSRPPCLRRLAAGRPTPHPSPRSGGDGDAPWPVPHQRQRLRHRPGRGRAATAAEAAGWESVWTGEHYALPDPPVPASPKRRTPRCSTPSSPWPTSPPTPARCGWARG